ncbi:MAG TPA: hypothetical protein VHH14_06780 [Solirubrobacterales bacterium]|nr:hypothetical protein [Solirubrobacterales bacterium]
MEAMRSTWTDSRLDDLNQRVTELTGRVGEMDARLTGRIDSLQHSMVQGFIALVVIMATGFMGIAGLIFTQI